MNPVRDEAIELDGPEGALEAVLSLPSSAATFGAVVLHPHPLYGGTMNNAVVIETSERLVGRGAAVLRFNFRGVGRSAGTHDRGVGELLDLEVAEQRMLDLYPQSELLTAGYSFGSAVLLASLKGASPYRTRASRLLSLAPPLTHYDFSHLEKNRVPLAVVTGEVDPLTPPDSVSRGQRWGEIRHWHELSGKGHDLGTQDGESRALSLALVECLEALA